MRSYITLDIRRSLRDPKFVALVIAWPVASYLLFATVFGSSGRTEGLSPKVAIMVAMACFGAIGTVLVQTGPRIGLERQIGWLRQMRLTPLSAWRLLTARIVAAILLTIPSIAFTFIAAFMANGIALPLATWIELAGIIAIGTVPFAAIGVVIGCLGGGDGAQGFTMSAYLVLASLGGLWMPVALLPAPLQTVSNLLPSNGLNSVGLHLIGGTSSAVRGGLVLAVWLVGAGAAALLASRRLAERA